MFSSREQVVTDDSVFRDGTLHGHSTGCMRFQDTFVNNKRSNGSDAHTHTDNTT